MSLSTIFSIDLRRNSSGENLERSPIKIAVWKVCVCDQYFGVVIMFEGPTRKSIKSTPHVIIYIYAVDSAT